MRFMKRYPIMAMKLRELGWLWDDGSLWHPELGADVRCPLI